MGYAKTNSINMRALSTQLGSSIYMYMYLKEQIYLYSTCILVIVMTSERLPLHCTHDIAQVVRNGSTFNGKPLIMKWYTPKVTPKMSSPSTGPANTSSSAMQPWQLPPSERSTDATPSPSSDEPVCLTVSVLFVYLHANKYTALAVLKSLFWTHFS